MIILKNLFRRQIIWLLFSNIYFLLPFNCFSQTKPGRLNGDQNLKYKTVSAQKDSIESGINKILDHYAGKQDSPSTWAAAKEEITKFLTKKWRAGILQGTKANQAFFVKADQTNMTQSDINMKKLVVVVGLAMLKPAEFDVLRMEKQL